MNKHLAENQVAAVRYIVNDVDSAVNFYSSKLGFDLDLHIKSKFAALSLGDLQLYINSPGAGEQDNQCRMVLSLCPEDGTVSNCK